ncbi:MAG: hypothetical protein ACE5IK_07320 [Acidobacteriota bacterium]
MSLSKKMACVSVVVLVLLLGLPAVVGAADCSIQAACCSASAGSYDANSEICSCSFTCSTEISSCSCTITGKTTIKLKSTAAGAPSDFAVRAPADLATAIPLDSNVGLRVQGGALDLERITVLLQNLSHWTVQAEPGVRQHRASGFWTGDLEDVLRQIARSFQADLSVDEMAKTVTFLPR